MFALIILFVIARLVLILIVCVLLRRRNLCLLLLQLQLLHPIQTLLFLHALHRLLHELRLRVDCDFLHPDFTLVALGDQSKGHLALSNPDATTQRRDTKLSL